MVYTEELEDKSSAIKREGEIKRMKSRKYIENLIYQPSQKRITESKPE